MPDTNSERFRESDVPADRRSADIAIVCTHSGELRPFLKRLDRRRKYVDQNVTFRGGFLNETIRVAVLEAGSDFAKQRDATQILISEHHPMWVISVGFSSSLSADLRAGDLSLANEIRDTHGNLRPVKCPIPESKRVHVQRHLVADRQPASVSDKLQLAARFDATAVDTTSLAVAQVCGERDTRFLSIRAIIDELSETIPTEAFAMIFRRDSKAVGGLLGGLVRNVKRVPALNQWRIRADEAAVHLDRFLVSLVSQLGEHLANRP